MTAKEINTDLWKKVRNDDRCAIEELYKRLYVDLFNYGIYTSGSAELTKDCINDLFLEIWDQRKRLREVKNVKSYFFTYLRRKLMAALRDQAKTAVASAEFSFSFPSYQASREENMLEEQNIQEIRKKILLAMEGLTARQRQLIRLRFFQNLSIDDIAGKADISTKTVYNILNHALKVIAGKLGSWLFLLFLLLILI